MQNCDGQACQPGQSCQNNGEYGCECVGVPYTPVPNTPKPTSDGGGGGRGGATLTAFPTDRATVIPTKTLSPYETACGAGKCTNGFYCCQQRNGEGYCTA